MREMSPLKYLVYTRRSTDDLVNQKNTIEYQTDQCLRFAGLRGLQVETDSLEGFCENGVIKERHTAFKTNGIKIMDNGRVEYKIERPKFQKLVSLLAKKKYRGVICLCWDRVSRNPHDDAIIKNMIGDGVDIHFVQAQYEQTSAGALHMDIDGMFAAHYSRVTSEKIRAANAKLRAEGKINNSAPLGYLNHGPDNKPLDPSCSHIIKALFEKYATGDWSMAQLANWADKQGLRTRPRRKYNRGQAQCFDTDRTDPPISRVVNTKNIEKILHNPFYAGFIQYKGEIMSGLHTPIIPEHLLKEVQNVFRQKSSNSKFHLDKDFYTYRGFLKCTCNRAYSPYTKKGIAYYSSPVIENCDNSKRNMSESLIDDIVVNLLGKVHLSDDETEDLERKSPRLFIEAAKNQNKTMEAYQKRTAHLHRDLAYLEENKISLLRERVYSPEEFAESQRNLHYEMEKIEKEKSELKSADLPKMLSYLMEFSELVKKAKLRYKSASKEIKHDIILNLISELYIKDGILAKYSAKPGCERLLKRGFAACGGP